MGNGAARRDGGPHSLHIGQKTRIGTGVLEKLSAPQEKNDCPMTKTLILFRHAKSAWPDNVEDHERPLAERGRKAAPVMAKWLLAKGLRPSVALVSTAKRTQETWALVAPELGKAT